ncbi:MAG: hypothetical protein U9R48_05990 [Chloroflexota bacterium]|nr:hypothetical protein [Chloroflexota bacterium]
MPEGICEALLNVIEDTYYGMRGSVTRGLRAALLEANEFLFERNLRLEEEQRLIVGINCAVLRGEDVYIGQLGPALLAVIRGDHVTRYPSDTVWLRTEEPGAFDLKREPPAGLRRDVEPDLFHETFAPEDVLLLATTNLVRLASDDDLLDAAAHATGDALNGGLMALASGQDLTAIVVEGAERRTSVVVEEREEEGASAPRETAVIAETETEESETQPPYAVPLVGEGPSHAEGEDARREEGETYAKDAKGVGLPGVDLEGLRQQVGQGVKNVRHKTEDLLLRVLPKELPERPEVQRAPRENISLSGRALVAIALVIPLLMLFIVIMTRLQYNNTRFERFDSLYRLAQSRYDAAMRMENQAQIRQGLYDTLEAVEKGLTIRPEDETLNELRRRAVHKLDEVDRVERLYNPWKLRELGDRAMARSDASRIVLHGIDVFLLNCGSDRVYKFLLNDVGDALQSADQDAILVQKGDLYGGVRIGDIVDIAWLESGGQRTLSTFVALERAGSLLTYDPQQGIDLLPVANSDQWLNPQAIGGYYGNLYVLDPLLGHILKYVPSNNAYTNPPSYYLDPRLDVDLMGAVDMAIDGNVYILFADGRIEKFYEGEPQIFSMDGLPSPMRSPTMLFVSGSAGEEESGGYVYVTDTGNERVIQFDKSGNYVRQFQDKEGGARMGALKAVYVDESSGRLFWVNGRTLWLANLPPLTQD